MIRIIQKRFKYIAEDDQPKNEKVYTDELVQKNAKINDHQIMPGAGGIFGSKNEPTLEEKRKVVVA